MHSCIAGLTIFAGVIDQDDVCQKVGRGAVHHAVDCSKEDGQSLVVETDDHARGREVLGVLLVLGLTPGRVHDRKLVRSQNKVKET